MGAPGRVAHLANVAEGSMNDTTGHVLTISAPIGVSLHDAISDSIRRRAPDHPGRLIVDVDEGDTHGV